MIIRAATPDDVPAIARVHFDSWRAAYREIIPAEILQSRSLEQRVQQWRSLIAAAGGTSWTHVALDGSEVIGFVSSRASPDTDGPGEVAAIYVAPQRWRGGAGTSLLNTALATLRAAGFEEATLWVLQDNGPARSFYERDGWRLDGKTQLLGDTTIVEVRYRRRLV